MTLLRLTLIALAVACATACATARVRPIRDLLGVTVGMPRADVHPRLAAAGTMQREERKRQEVWEVRDPRFDGVIVGYDAEWNVRFVTAVARKGGTPVRFDDVLDRATATHQSTGTSHRYTSRVDGYTIIAIGNDPEVAMYVTLTKGEDELP